MPYKENLYTFSPRKGNAVTVEAANEDAARHKVMVIVYGPPVDWCRNNGHGLQLDKVVEGYQR